MTDSPINLKRAARGISRPRAAALLQAAILIAITAAAYAPSLHGSWQYDDQLVIVSNSVVRDAGEALRRLGTSTRSLVQWTFALNHRLGGLAPFGYHVVNLAIHVAAALCLWGWLRSLPHARRFAWAAALIFAVHPLATQSVAYVAQRYSSMAGLFFFAALWAWSAYRSGGGRMWYAAALLAALAAMLSKEMAVAIPLALMAADFSLHAGHRRNTRHFRCVAEYVPLVALLAVVPLLNLFNRGMAVEDFAASLNWADGTNLTPWSYFVSQLPVLVYVYLRLMLLPIGQSVEHDPVMAGSIADARVLTAAAVLIVLLTASLLAAFGAHNPRRRLTGFGGLLFFLGLGATSTLVPNTQLVQEQRTYVSLAGVVVAACGLLWPLVERRPKLRLGLVLPIFATLAWATHERCIVWRSPEALWRDAMEKAPHSVRAHNNLGLALADLGRAEEAASHYRRALELNPRFACAWNNLGNLHFKLGRSREAAGAYATAARLAPEFADAHCNLAAALERLGRADQAVAAGSHALRLRSDYADAHNNLGNALRAAGRAAEALPHLRSAIGLYERFDQPDRQARACNNLANALAGLGKHAEALKLYAEALRLEPGYATAARNRAAVLAAIGRAEGADAAESAAHANAAAARATRETHITTPMEDKP